MSVLTAVNGGAGFNQGELLLRTDRSLELDTLYIADSDISDKIHRQPSLSGSTSGGISG